MERIVKKFLPLLLLWPLLAQDCKNCLLSP